jgi:hypothetical protein
MHREKRERPQAFCPIQLARKSTHAGRIEWQANRAYAVRSVNRTFVRTTGRPRDEIRRTAWELKSGINNLDVPATKKRNAKVDRLLRRRCHRRRPIIIASAPRRKPGGEAALANALRTTRSTLDQELARSAITSRIMRRLSRKKLTLLPSAWFQRTGISRIRKPARCAR